jgi:methylated-DNA-[protein]-cysteine S-methyltransferase
MRFGYSLFETALGHCAVAWSARGLVLVLLPEARESAVRARLARRLPDAREATPPAEAARAREGIEALLRGAPSDLTQVPLDMTGVPPFDRRVYEAARTIPAGETRSYGEIAALLGDPSWASGVGRALARNPFSLVVPCHRVLAAGGAIGGFSARGGVTTKRRLLAIEAAAADPQPGLFDASEAGRSRPSSAPSSRRRAGRALSP